MRDTIITKRLVDYAREFAETAHMGQRHGLRPYTQHLEDVATLVRPCGFIYEVVAYLHDVVEGTHITIGDIGVEFGIEVKRQVDLLTPPLGHSKGSRKRKHYKRLQAAPVERYRPALVVKVADRLANVRESREFSAILEMYASEHQAFRRALYRPGMCDAFWIELDRTFSEASVA